MSGEVAVKAQDKLAALGLDRRLASHHLPDIRAKENIRYELAQSQYLLTPPGESDRRRRCWVSVSGIARLFNQERCVIVCSLPARMVATKSPETC
jgi:hypothetical protein